MGECITFWRNKHNITPWPTHFNTISRLSVFKTLPKQVDYDSFRLNIFLIFHATDNKFLCPRDTPFARNPPLICWAPFLNLTGRGGNELWLGDLLRVLRRFQIICLVSKISKLLLKIILFSTWPERELDQGISDQISWTMFLPTTIIVDNILLCSFNIEGIQRCLA